MARPDVAEILEGCFLFGHGRWYELESWCIMPNHAHVLIRPNGTADLCEIVESWKKFSARRANAILGRSGPFWYREYFDRYIRDPEHRERAIRYIERNPVKTGLCAEAGEWRWSSARRRTGDGSLELA
ncbi:MAG TPA: transposase [Fimbriimonas sp.]